MKLCASTANAASAIDANASVFKGIFTIAWAHTS
jgi:hypothetical protein